MYKEILKEQLEKLRNYQVKCSSGIEPAEFIRLSDMIQETAARLEHVGNTAAAEMELSCLMQKEEILEDFSNAELIQELEKRGVLKISELTPDITLLTGSIYHAD